MQNSQKKQGGWLRLIQIFSIIALVFNMSFSSGIFLNVIEAQALTVDLCSDFGGDTDGDGVCDNTDNCVLDPNPDQIDSDNDIYGGDACDPCPFTSETTCNMPELCNGIDDNGDSLVDENFPNLGQACSACDGNGVYVCNAAGDAAVCSAEDFCSAPADCIDDDEDGYGIGDDCIDTDCNDDASHAWQMSCFYYDMDGDGYHKPFPDNELGQACWCMGDSFPTYASERSSGVDCDDDNSELTTDCGEAEPKTATIKAYKVVCESEIYLPNWGEIELIENEPYSEPSLITAGTAADYVDRVNEFYDREVCWMQDNWQFQWGYGAQGDQPGVHKVGDGAFVGEANGTPSSGMCSVGFCGENTNTGDGYEDWKTFGPTDNNGETSVMIEDLAGADTLWVREVLQAGFIPFTYPEAGPREDNVTAELYCKDDILNYDNYESILGVEDGGEYYCVAFNAPKRVKINAHKVVCKDEMYLPNWGQIELIPGEPNRIMFDTAADYVANINNLNEETVCWLDDDWQFQWGYNHTAEGGDGVHKLTGSHVGLADGTDTSGLCGGEFCGPNTFTGDDHDEWKTFEGVTGENGVISLALEEDALVGETGIWVREVLKDDYVPYSYPTSGARDNDVSAELYCEDDIVNYDNYDLIDNLTESGVYNCIAFNAPKNDCDNTVEGYKYNNLTHRTMGGWLITLESEDGQFTATTTTDSNGHYIFENICDGDYSIYEEDRWGWRVDGPEGGVYDFSLPFTRESEYDGYNFYNRPMICGHKYNFADNALLEGWTMTLTGDSSECDGDCPEINETRTTDADGEYCFAPAIGRYQVTEETRDSWTPNGGYYTLPAVFDGSEPLFVDFFNIYGGDTDCGDEVCSGNENCETCPADCGQCEEEGSCDGYALYTSNADFSEGNMINLSQDPADQLQLDETVTPFGFVWVSVSSKGTIVKINTETGAVMGEYRTSPNGTSGNPSRTTVDKDGSVWVGNRQPVSGSNAAITHIGLAENGQCEDRNGNGTIDTSTGFGDVKAWTDESGARGVATAEDECIVHFRPIASSDARHISVNANNDVWVSGINTRNFWLVKGGKWNVPDSGTIIRTESSISYGGYGGLIDSNNVIWSANPLLWWDTAYPLSDVDHHQTYGHDSYGLCLDKQGNVWNTSLSGGVIRKFAPDGTLIDTYSHGGSYAQGCVVDNDNNVWVAHSLWGNSVGHLLTDGTLVGVIPVGSGPTGVAVDVDGKIWVTHNVSNNVMRIDPSLGETGNGGVKIGAVDYTSGDMGGNLYNYSDMTGSALSGKADNGIWTIVRDSGLSGYAWSDVSWNANVPAGASITATIETSEDNSVWSAPQTITSGQALSGVTGQYLKIKVSFARSETGAGPILYDLTIDQDCGGAEPDCGDGSCNGNENCETCAADCSQCGDEYCGDETCNNGETCSTCSADCGVCKSSSGGRPPYDGSGAFLTASTPQGPTVLGEEGAPVLQVTKIANKETVNPGDEIEFVITVKNTGNLTAFNVNVKDILPAGMEFVDLTGEDYSFSFGDIEAGAEKSVTVKTRIKKDAEAKQYVNNVTVTANNHPEMQANDDVAVELVKVLAATGMDYSELSFLLGMMILSISGAVSLRRRSAK